MELQHSSDEIADTREGSDKEMTSDEELETKLIEKSRLENEVPNQESQERNRES